MAGQACSQPGGGGTINLNVPAPSIRYWLTWVFFRNDKVASSVACTGDNHSDEYKRNQNWYS